MVIKRLLYPAHCKVDTGFDEEGDVMVSRDIRVETTMEGNEESLRKNGRRFTTTVVVKGKNGEELEILYSGRSLNELARFDGQKQLVSACLASFSEIALRGGLAFDVGQEGICGLVTVEVFDIEGRWRLEEKIIRLLEYVEMLFELGVEPFGISAEFGCGL